jgi:hypothetical protein
VDTTKDTAPPPTTTREKGTCSGCGTTTKTLTAPRPGARDHEGMYCLSCNPRFLGTLEMHYSSLERLA